MTEYELAKKLKDAGFPNVTKWEVENNYRRTITATGEYSLPPLGALLSELPRCTILVKGEGEWATCKNEGIWIRENNGYIDTGNETFFTGTTPEIAAANLWLELKSSLPPSDKMR